MKCISLVLKNAVCVGRVNVLCFVGIVGIKF
jgi:hypothetical protein